MAALRWFKLVRTSFNSGIRVFEKRSHCMAIETKSRGCTNYDCDHIRYHFVNQKLKADAGFYLD